MSSNSNKVAVIVGYGTGISNAVATKFGGLGYKVALVSRTQSKLDDAAKALSQQGITAKGFAQDVSKPEEVKTLFKKIHDTFGTIGIIHWNAYGGSANITDGKLDVITDAIVIASTSVIAAVQASLDDLKATKGSILLTGGGLGLENEFVTNLALSWGAASLAIAKAAMRKTTHLLNSSLKEFGIYAGEVTVLGAVKGTAWDDGKGQAIPPEKIADEFARLHEKRDQIWKKYMSTSIRGQVAVIVGYGTGISNAVANKFGGLGYKIALVCRTASKLNHAVKALSEKGITAKGFVQDVSKPDKVKILFKVIHDAFGTIAIIHWQAAGTRTDLFNGNLDLITDAINISSTSIIAAVQSSLEDLKSTKGSVLLTGSGLGLENDSVAKAAVERGVGSLAIGKAAMRKTTHLLNLALREDTISPETIADEFVRLHEMRDRVWVDILPESGLVIVGQNLYKIMNVGMSMPYFRLDSM
ncbi:hypothetical protein HDU76_002394 [Blyttiomyces sp. JEL0837]|nr:hypothetical protein HDU76_002394 [Blyttiomyces sp. JEL0837]